MVNLKAPTTQLAVQLIRRENLIALLESGVEFGPDFSEDTRQYMLATALLEKQLLQKEISNRTIKEGFKTFLDKRDRQILYCQSETELQQKGMPAPLRFIVGAPKQAGQ